MGLIKASEKFNEEYNTKFSTYAYTFILGEMKKYVREDKGIKLSYDLQKLGYKIEKLRLNVISKTNERTYYFWTSEYYWCKWNTSNRGT